MLNLKAVGDTTCKYLFGQEAEKIFGNVKIPNISDKRKYIDGYLETLMKINVYLLTEKDTFYLIDPMALNNQCHLYSLRAAQIRKKYPGKTEKEKMERNEENRFLHLSFFITFSILPDTGLLMDVVKKALREMKEKPPVPVVHFKTFLRDDGRCREKASRIALNQVFERYMKEILSKLKVEKPLYAELSDIAHEKLQIISNRGYDLADTYQYTYPKIAGIAYFIDAIAQEHIPFVLKVKVLTKDGYGGTIVQASGKIHEKDPVLVFEAYATDGSYSLPTCESESKRCPSAFRRHSDKNKRHLEDETCFFCQKVSIDLQPFHQRLQMAMKNPEEMLYALGADFILNIQKDFKVLFENNAKYPLLSKIFHDSIPKIKELGLDMNNPETFSVCHVHPEDSKEALSENFQLEVRQEVFLRRRGII